MKHYKCSPINKNILYYDFEHRMCIFRMINKVPAMMKKVNNRISIFRKKNLQEINRGKWKTQGKTKSNPYCVTLGFFINL